MNPQTERGLRVLVFCCSWGGRVWGLQACTTPEALIIVCLHHLLLTASIQNATLSTVWWNGHSWGCGRRTSSCQQCFRTAHTFQQIPCKFHLYYGSMNNVCFGSMIIWKSVFDIIPYTHVKLPNAYLTKTLYQLHLPKTRIACSVTYNGPAQFNENKKNLW